jgi:hypothetical protein
MIPDWVPAAILCAPSFAVAKIVTGIAIFGRPDIDVRGRPVIAACLSYTDFQRRCSLCRRTVSLAIPAAVALGWVECRPPGRGRKTTYTIPVYRPEKGIPPFPAPANLNCLPDGIVSSPNEPVRQTGIPDAIVSPDILSRPTPAPARPAETPSLVAQPSVCRDNNPNSGYYDAGLAWSGKAAYEKARAIKGLDDEIALFRSKLLELVSQEPGRVDLWIKVADSLARLMNARNRLARDRKPGFQDADERLYREVAGPAGISRELFFNGLPEEPQDVHR